ncbi:MAG: YbaB/EbfC family nucleoid-associated protein [Candidatus Krumholzibacteriia bacterium]
MDMRQIMKQAQQMQQRMAALQEELAGREVTATVAGGQVTIVMNGRHEVTRIAIQPSAVDPQDVEFLQDLIVSAFNEAVRQVDAMSEKEMGAVTGGLAIPGFPSPGQGR